MFVSVVLDPSQIDSAKELALVLDRFGFTKVQRACWENNSITDRVLTQLKREIDEITDSYDVVRFYQYPVDGKFVITELNQKKWKRTVLLSKDQ